MYIHINVCIRDVIQEKFSSVPTVALTSAGNAKTVPVENANSRLPDSCAIEKKLKKVRV